MKLRNIARVFSGLAILFYCNSPLYGASGCNYPTSLDTFSDKSTGDFLTVADVNTRACAIEQLEVRLDQVLNGKAGGQTITGGTATGEDLTFSSTSHATKGNIFFGNSTYDEANNRLGIGTAVPSFQVHIINPKADSTSADVIRFDSAQGTPRRFAINLGGDDTFAVGSISNHTVDLIQNGAPRVRILGATGVGIGGATGPTPETRLHLFDDPAITYEESLTTPSNPADGTQVRAYMKADKFILQYNQAGTIRYKYLDLTGTGTGWTHTTVAP